MAAVWEEGVMYGQEGPADWGLLGAAMWVMFGILTLAFVSAFVCLAFNWWFRTAITIHIIEDSFWRDPAVARALCPNPAEREERLANWFQANLNLSAHLSVACYTNSDWNEIVVDRFSILSPVRIAWNAGWYAAVEGSDTEIGLQRVIQCVVKAADIPDIVLTAISNSTSS